MLKEENKLILHILIPTLECLYIHTKPTTLVLDLFVEEIMKIKWNIHYTYNDQIRFSQY